MMVLSSSETTTRLPTPAVDDRLGAPLAYVPVWHEMQAFTDARTADSPDAFWVLEHEPVFTQGSNGRPEHVLLPGDIPVVPSDRGGQVTYHGPGQLMIYVLVDIKRLGIGVRSLVTALENAMIDTLADYAITAHSRRDAPGVYVDGAKIGSIGLRIRRGASYHGLAFNVNNDLEPFARINPCGYANLPVTRSADLGGPADTGTAARGLLAHLCRHLQLPTPAYMP